ncbi:MAG TPA: endonuclease domain-containing protein [Allosphingosinicella sp.]|jgi:very-short-patch-repair endonuclease
MALIDRSATRNAAVIRARVLRRRPSLPEGLLWQLLRTRPGGLKFRRQHPFERCTADFYCPAACGVVEVDGDSHSMGDNPASDARRDAWLRTQGLRVLRFEAMDVLKDVESVVTAIMLAARR